MISCDPNDLASAASCFQCLREKFLKIVRTYLLCQATSKFNRVNLITEGAMYGATGLYQQGGFVAGHVYTFIFGANEKQISSGVNTITASGTLLYAAGFITFAATPLKNVPVTAKMYF